MSQPAWSCRGFGRERELQRWQPSAEDAALEGIEDSAMPRGGGGNGGGAWDQFEANHKQFGVQVRLSQASSMTVQASADLLPIFFGPEVRL